MTEQSVWQHWLAWQSLPRADVPRGRGPPVRSSKALWRGPELCAAAGFGSRSLRLCVMYIPQNILGLDRTFPSPNFVEPQTFNFGKNQVLLSGCHPCGSSSTGADQLLANSLVHHEGLDGPYLRGRGECTVPVAALPSPSMGGDIWTGPLYYTLCTGVCTVSAPAARLLAACK